MKEFELVEPGYPIYKSYIVPRTIDRNRVYARRLTRQDVESWGRILERLKEFLTDIIGFVEKIRDYRPSLPELYELLADCIVLFFKVPLNRDVLPSVAPSPIKAYLLSRLLWREMRGQVAQSPLKFTLTCYGDPLVKFCQSGAASVFNDHELISMVEEAWLNIPADTRPGANSSGLIPHMLLTSSIAWALAVDGGSKREEAAKIRLAALLHDVGKPFNYREHYEVSPRVAEYILRDVLDSDVLAGLIKEIEAHHRTSSYLHQADVYASGIDRLRPYIDRTIDAKIGEWAKSLGLDHELAWSSGKEAWMFWESLERGRPGTVEQLSNEFGERVHKRVQIEAQEGNVKDKLLVFLFDIGGIQDFIKRSSELRCIAAASTVVDVVTMAHVPLMIQKVVEENVEQWLPAEAFLYTSGGVVTLLAPASLKRVMDSVLDELRNLYRRDRLKIYMASTTLNTNYYTTSGRLASKMLMAKLEDDGCYAPIRLEAENLCELCRNETGTQQLATGGPRVCSTCNDLYEIGNELHFRQRWEAQVSFGGQSFTPRKVFGDMDWQQVSGGIMELLAGHSVNDLASLGLITGGPNASSRRPRIRNIGLIKVDGNLMGSFFGESVSITDALERSARVDIALKKAVYEAVEKLATAIDNRVEVQRLASLVSLGILYIGGDDAMLLCPSWAAIPLAYQIGQIFSREMGLSASLSIGVVATPPKHDIWASVDAVSKLLDIAKGEGRRHAGGAFCFDTIEGGSVSGSAVQERHESMKKRMITSQPFVFTNGQGVTRFSIEEVLQLLCETVETGGSVDVFELAYRASRDVDDGVKRELKRIRADIRRVVRVGESYRIGEKWYLYSIVYSHRMGGARGYEFLRRMLSRWLEFAQGDRLAGLPLADVDLLIKLLGGGVL